MYKLDFEKTEEQRSNCEHPFDHRKAGVSEGAVQAKGRIPRHWGSLSDPAAAAAAAAAKSLQSCPTLCDPIDGSSPGSPVPGILQARTLEWVAISFSNA